MRLGLISDTHDHLDHIRQALELFQRHAVEQVLHAGDMCSPPALQALAGVPLAGVLGNNDGELLGLMRTGQALGARLERDLLELELAGQRVAVYHGTVAAIKASLIASGRYDMVVTGHTHRAEHRQEGSVTVLNPGTAHGFGQGASVMLYDLATARSELLPLG